MAQYHTAQVCLEGHLLTGSIQTDPGRMQKFCGRCGSETITNCPGCEKPIRGDYYGPGYCSPCHHPPLYCYACGAPLPWTETKIRAAVEVFVEFGSLEEAECKTIEADIANIARGTAAAELSARRVKRIWDRAGQIGYEILMEFATKTAAEMLKNQ